MELYKIGWIIAFVVFLIIEAVSAGLVSIWFAFGSLVALLVTFLGASLWLQVAFFLATSALLLLFTRPITKKWLDVRITKTNADSLVGQKAVVTKAIFPNEYGQVKIKGQSWTAKSFNDDAIEVHKEVDIMSIEGVKLIVKERQ